MDLISTWEHRDEYTNKQTNVYGPFMRIYDRNAKKILKKKQN